MEYTKIKLMKVTEEHERWLVKYPYGAVGYENIPLSLLTVDEEGNITRCTCGWVVDRDSCVLSEEVKTFRDHTCSTNFINHYSTIGKCPSCGEKLFEKDGGFDETAKARHDRIAKEYGDDDAEYSAFHSLGGNEVQ